MNIGERIRNIREAKGFNQKDIANELGITVQAISQYETGVRIPRMLILKGIARTLNVSLNDLLEEKTEKTEKAETPQNSITLRFLDIDKLPSEREQIIKVVEEMYEFLNAENDENQIEEFYDLVQASLNLMQIRNFNLKEICEGEVKHVRKLRKRGWNI